MFFFASEKSFLFSCFTKKRRRHPSQKSLFYLIFHEGATTNHLAPLKKAKPMPLVFGLTHDF
jgi:hypothetical protein